MLNYIINPAIHYYPSRIPILWLLFLFILFCSSAGIPAYGQADSTVRAIEAELVYTALPWYNASGGLETGFVYMDNADVTAKISLDQIFNMSNRLTLFAYGLGNHGGRATALMGDFQVASNIEATQTWRLFECWSQYNLFNDRLSVLVGLYDLNSEFDVLKPGTLFINSSFGIGAEYAQSGKNGPAIFPISSFGIRLTTVIGEHIRYRFALLDGVPGDPGNLKSNEISLSYDDGVLVASELSIYNSGQENEEARYQLERATVTRRRKVGREYEFPSADKVNIGWWYYINRFRPINDSTNLRFGNTGAYIGMQQYFSLGTEADYVALFACYGVANDDFNRFGSALSGGMVISNPFVRSNHSLGLAFSSGFNGRAFQELQANSSEISETVVELTYAMSVGSWLLVQPDVQYIVNPSTRAELKNSLAFGLLIQGSLPLL